MRPLITLAIVSAVTLCIGLFAGSLWHDRMPWSSADMFSDTPLGDLVETIEPERPLERYTFQTLRTETFEPAHVAITEELATNPDFTSYLVMIQTLDKTMSGQLNIPTEVTDDTPVIIMLRGYVSPDIYFTGLGTRNGAAEYARAGYITLAPDFFGYGQSDPEPEDSWQARFEKPIIVAEILNGVRELGVPTTNGSHATDRIGLWGHSNGGQIALSVLEILQEPIPATLWAPVTAPFPYSVLFFTIDHDDDGRGMRLWINQLESIYDLHNFSITRHLDGLRGPLMIHHGSGDDAALLDWSRRFANLVDEENERRESLISTASAELAVPEPIGFTLHTYPGADHNLQPGWNTVVERDILFFDRHLK
ncbi:MAG: hypothetical protein WDZ94_00555 [Patescibacteria group bacterium]